MTALLRTAADFDTLPDETTIVAIEVPAVDFMPTHRRRTLWRKYGREFVHLDPGDRNNGEESKSGGYLENFLLGFGSRNSAPGIAFVLGDGDQISSASVEQLPAGTVIQLDGEDFPHLALGSGRWEYLDPADVYDGDYDVETANLVSGEVTVQVLYRPGDEVTAGFDPTAASPEPEPVATGEPDIPREPVAVTETPNFEDALRQYAKVYSFLHSQAEIDLVKMTDDELATFGEALGGPTQTNCGFEFYQVAQILRPLYDREKFRRARENGTAP